ncbi:hypothetical protein MNBD_GAMMA12-3088 [hydrothermal vent metagenome]|uniref:Uncharacterized protein n=1 Tax=hydrothermal vent metagenome TaxID=652676 RepID=A0A3B0ZQT2_9ZZZZ
MKRLALTYILCSLLSAPAIARETALGSKSQSFILATGHKIVVKHKTIIIYSKNGNELVRNTKIIRGSDETKSCPSDGFLGIAKKGLYFTVEQSNCGGWNLIVEYITFRYSKNDNKFYLHKLGLSYLDRRAPNKKTKDIVYSRHYFGLVNFSKVSTGMLYR